MKITRLFSILSFLIVHTGTQTVLAQPTEKNFNKITWIEGTWVRTNSKAGQTGHERWTRSSPNKFTGQSVTLKDSDTLFVERIDIMIKDDHIYYVADVPENKTPIYFMFTEVTESGFICENPEHDFPKKITYEYNNGILKASISGNGKVIDYYFRRK